MSDEILIHDENDLRTKIHTIRGVQVMLDFDLAEIYGYETRSFVSVNSSLNYSTHSPRILKGVISMFQGSSLFQSSAV